MPLVTLVLLRLDVTGVELENLAQLDATLLQLSLIGWGVFNVGEDVSHGELEADDDQYVEDERVTMFEVVLQVLMGTIEVLIVTGVRGVFVSVENGSCIASELSTEDNGEGGEGDPGSGLLGEGSRAELPWVEIISRLLRDYNITKGKKMDITTHVSKGKNF